MKAIPITSTKDITILKANKKITINQDTSIPDKYLTWIRNECKMRCFYLIENNRYEVNFDIGCFDIVKCKIPLYLQEQLIEEQKQQGVEPNILPFIERIYAGKNQNGFDWNKSIRGEKYWNGVYDAFVYNIPLPIEQTFNFDIL